MLYNKVDVYHEYIWLILNYLNLCFLIHAECLIQLNKLSCTHHTMTSVVKVEELLASQGHEINKLINLLCN